MRLVLRSNILPNAVNRGVSMKESTQWLCNGVSQGTAVETGNRTKCTGLCSAIIDLATKLQSNESRAP